MKQRTSRFCWSARDRTPHAPAALRERCRAEKIAAEADGDRAAVRTFNVLLAEARSVAAAIGGGAVMSGRPTASPMAAAYARAAETVQSA